MEAGREDPKELYSRTRYRLASGDLLQDAPPPEQVAGVQWRLLEALAPDDAVHFRYHVRVLADTLATGRGD